MITTTNSSSNPHTARGLSSENLVDSNCQKVIGGIIPIFKGQVIQFLGLVPLNPCTPDECRTYPESEYINPVVANPSNSDYYYNDYNTFIIDYPFYNSYNIKFILQEQINGVWTDTVVLNNNNNGLYVPFGTVPNYPSLGGYQIDWHKVFDNYGEGKYRFRVEIWKIWKPPVLFYCLVSEPFCLMEWNCVNVRRTVKFEITLQNGVIGSAINPAYLFDLCNLQNWYYSDSIRFEGFFGYEKADYERKNIEYNNGIIYHLRDEVIKRFDMQSGQLPKWLHDRFKAYALMADKILVSDYNHNNPDWNIKRKGVVCDSGYEPVYQQFTRYSRVKVSFKEDQQNLIRRRCCSDRKGASAKICEGC